MLSGRARAAACPTPLSATTSLTVEGFRPVAETAVQQIGCYSWIWIFGFIAYRACSARQRRDCRTLSAAWPTGCPSSCWSPRSVSPRALLAARCLWVPGGAMGAEPELANAGRSQAGPTPDVWSLALVCDRSAPALRACPAHAPARAA